MFEEMKSFLSQEPSFSPIKHMANTEHFFLKISGRDLNHFSPNLYNQVINYPSDLIAYLDGAATEILH